MSLAMEDLSLEDTFDSFCIVCDRLIVPPKDKEVEPKPKKKPAGAIRVKNPDGSTTTRTANGTKTTRPGLKRNQGSSSRLATVAANNHAASKLAPLSRTKTTDSKSSNGDDAGAVSPKSPEAGPFVSSIYCSHSCAQVEQGRSEAIGKDLARTFSGADLGNYHHRPSMDGIITNIDIQNNPYAPPSPLFVSSDTESSNSLGAPADSGPASSAPKVMEYFRFSRGGPDDAWNDVQRQRRSSMNPPFRPTEMSRQNTQTSSHYTFSSDSLSSMWDPDLYLGRSASNSGKMRMTPMSHPEDDNAKAGAGAGPAPIPTRPPLARSNLSHTSLGASPNDMDLLKSYADSFHGRNVLSSSYNTHRGSLAIPAPGGMPTTTPLDARRASMHAPSARPSSGTIRAKSGITWDSLGKQAVKEREQACRLRRAESHCLGADVDSTSPAGLSVPKRQTMPQHDATPRQSLKVENGQWKVVQISDCYGLGKNGTIRSKSRADSRSTQSSHSSGSSDLPPTSGLAPASVSAIASSPASTMTIPCSASASASASTSTSTALAYGTPTASASTSLHSHSRSPGPNWGDYEIRGGKTYAIPKGLQVNTQKAGLFYFH